MLNSCFQLVVSDLKRLGLLAKRDVPQLQLLKLLFRFLNQMFIFFYASPLDRLIGFYFAQLLLNRTERVCPRGFGGGRAPRESQDAND